MWSGRVWLKSATGNSRTGITGNKLLLTYEQIPANFEDFCILVCVIVVLRASSSVSPGGRPSPCRLRRTVTAIWLEETRGASKNHLAENDRRWRSAPELWSPHGVEEDKGHGNLTTSCQYGNALLGVRYQEEEEVIVLYCIAISAVGE